MSNCTPLPKAAKPVWAKQLTRLPCLVVCVNFQFEENVVENFKYAFIGDLQQWSMTHAILLHKTPILHAMASPSSRF